MALPLHRALLRVAGGIVGRLKGSSFFIWFLISGPCRSSGSRPRCCYRWDRNELRRECPGCGRVVKLHDALCTRCGTELEFPDVAIASRVAAPQARERAELPQ